eukprot:TRINITY_DN1441_c0_g6_i1.p3 TRINITY_DN1441_c0_g6~~TRINITY_DN1441_c0_g6_i1.p3  ORF type:complete len:114 (+),score=7.60 TRINITY_DN1441_c0_g6_i1:224-565(+)
MTANRHVTARPNDAATVTVGLVGRAILRRASFKDGDPAHRCAANAETLRTKNPTPINPDRHSTSTAIKIPENHPSPIRRIANQITAMADVRIAARNSHAPECCVPEPRGVLSV